jgi:hypothetical protein
MADVTVTIGAQDDGSLGAAINNAKTQLAGLQSTGGTYLHHFATEKPQPGPLTSAAMAQVAARQAAGPLGLSMDAMKRGKEAIEELGRGFKGVQQDEEEVAETTGRTSSQFERMFTRIAERLVIFEAIRLALGAVKNAFMEAANAQDQFVQIQATTGQSVEQTEQSVDALEFIANKTGQSFSKFVEPAFRGLINIGMGADQATAETLALSAALTRTGIDLSQIAQRAEFGKLSFEEMAKAFRGLEEPDLSRQMHDWAQAQQINEEYNKGLQRTHELAQRVWQDISREIQRAAQDADRAWARAWEDFERNMQRVWQDYDRRVQRANQDIDRLKNAQDNFASSIGLIKSVFEEKFPQEQTGTELAAAQQEELDNLQRKMGPRIKQQLRQGERQIAKEEGLSISEVEKMAKLRMISPEELMAASKRANEEARQAKDREAEDKRLGQQREAEDARREQQRQIEDQRRTQERQRDDQERTQERNFNDQIYTRGQAFETARREANAKVRDLLNDQAGTIQKIIDISPTMLQQARDFAAAWEQAERNIGKAAQAYDDLQKKVPGGAFGLSEYGVGQFYPGAPAPETGADPQLASILNAIQDQNKYLQAVTTVQ